MKNTTEYLFDKPRAYFEPELTILAEKRVGAAKALLKKLAVHKQDEARYLAAKKSKEHWEEILDEPTGTPDRRSFLGSVNDKKFRPSLSFMERKNRQNTNSPTNSRRKQSQKLPNSN